MASPSDPDTDTARQLQELVLGSETFEQFLDELAVLAAAGFDRDVSVGLTLDRQGHTTTVSNSDAQAAKYDEIQYSFDHGPCLTAMRTGETVVVDDLAEDDRWGPYQSHALLLGAQSSVSHPLSGGRGVVGALNVYARDPHVFGPAEQELAGRFAAEASRALVLAVRFAAQAELSEQLGAALKSRTVIDHAIGIVMAQTRCDAAQAFAILRSASQNRNIKLRVLATEIVTTVGGRPPTEVPFG